MARDNFKELRIWILVGVAVVAAITAPLVWSQIAGARADQAASDEMGRRIVELIAEDRADAAWDSAQVYLRDPKAKADLLADAGDAFLGADRPDEAFLLYVASEELAPSGATSRRAAEASLARGKPGDAVVYANRALSEGAGGRAGNLFLGECLLAAGRDVDAVTVFSDILTLYPGDAEALRGKARAFQAIDRFGQAKALWEQYLQATAEDGSADTAVLRREAAWRHAQCLEGLGLADEALTAWSALLADAAAAGDVGYRRIALSGRADHFQAAGRLVEEEADLRALLDLSAPSDRGLVDLRLALSLLGQGRDAEAAAQVADLLEADPQGAVPLLADARFAPLCGLLLPVR